MKKVIAIGASNSKNSINKKLASHVANRIKEVDVTVLDLNAFDIPMYGIDLEKEKGIPDEVHRFNQFIESADGLVISLAEHNGSYTAAFKSIYDWLSRIDKKVWKNKPMLLMATSPGGRGGATVLENAKVRFPRMGANVIAEFSLPNFYDNYSEKAIHDEALEAELKEKVLTFQDAVQNHKEDHLI